MPELPDLLYQRDHLRAHVRGRTVTEARVHRPVVLRMAVQGPFERVLPGVVITEISVHGPFLQFALSHDLSLVVNQMLAGRLQHQASGRPLPGLCLSLALDDGTRLNLCDPDLMAKAYLVPSRDMSAIPQWGRQGVDVLSADFTPELLRELARRHGGRQARSFINDATILSAIGNAYADEILHAAGIHPKTFLRTLPDALLDRLHAAVVEVLRSGIAAVRAAGRPIHEKVRDHMRVRRRHGEPCPRCGTVIRREGVRGRDVFFCPRCQPATRSLFLRWENR
jgi:formamidopyrimidine-DNA glycosylase